MDRASDSQRGGEVRAISLVCDPDRRAVYAELLANSGIAVSEGGRPRFIEAGSPIPEDGPALVFHSAEELSELLDQLRLGARGGPERSRLLVKDKDGYRLMDKKSVLFFIAEADSVYCVSESGRHEIQKKLYELEAELRASEFTRIHKSVIVNVRQILHISPYFGGRLLLRLRNDVELEVARSYVPAFKDYIHF
jgi:DNA-binding LytR/AlgR family response regulator